MKRTSWLILAIMGLLTAGCPRAGTAPPSPRPAAPAATHPQAGRDLGAPGDTQPDAPAAEPLSATESDGVRRPAVAPAADERDLGLPILDVPSEPACAG